MEIESSASCEKVGCFAKGWLWLNALPKKFSDKVVGIAKKFKKIGQDDPRRVFHSLKVGLALSLVSLCYYFRPLYKSFGDSAIWAVLTVVVVFEYSVGATLSKCLNRGFATLLAGAFGVGAHHLSSLAGEKGEPIILGILVFLLAGAATFTRFVPHIKARYDYGVLIFILTFSLVSVSGYRIDKIIELAQERLSTIVLGGLACVIISIVVCPVWAGEDLHKLVAVNMEKLADFLEGFGGEYFESKGDGETADVVSKNDKSFLTGYKSVLNTKASEESLANFARWEPCHGRFGFRHPWKQYLKVGALTRQCAYRVEALNSYINSDLQTPLEFKKSIQEACTKMSSESGKALRELALGLRAMKHANTVDTHLISSKNTANDFKTTREITLPTNIDILQVIPAATVASLLVEIVACTEEIAEAVHELAFLAKFKSVDPSTTSEKTHPQLLHRGTVNPLSDDNTDEGPHVVIRVCEPFVKFPEAKVWKCNVCSYTDL